MVNLEQHALYAMHWYAIDALEVIDLIDHARKKVEMDEDTYIRLITQAKQLVPCITTCEETACIELIYWNNYSGLVRMRQVAYFAQGKVHFDEERDVLIPYESDIFF